ncbi:ROK family protein [Jiangella alkaliphila]|uniref:Sugar kinase of the NBD/HSP70 family, may contain an N-terminal HTH domain n=1 Tax=Jiangella alkaliphila TaxID=419479 RepID=A0A1H2LAG3_9ACTN|nr:ROK family protein [Jiangella alkaliphila]SDU77909.1 Sugar kinase of the NBD/HSP70 family, may contain an N-terminal HTH domain [Jiangella alkaliphila]
MTGSDSARRRASSAPESATVVSLRRTNRAHVLRQIVLAGQTTRATIARDTGLSLASATHLVSELIAEGLVIEAGSKASRGGRPITLIEPRPDGAYFIGADVGERGVAVELFDLTMTRVDREFRGGREPEAPEDIAHDLDDAIEALRERNPRAWRHLVGAGLGLPGIVETEADGRQVLYAQSLAWPPVGIADLVSHDLPVHAENGAKTQAKAEQWFGAARGVDYAVVVLLGRGVGLGIIAGGSLQYGSTSSAAEWGHLKIERNGRRCRCGARGCVEAYVGADAILSAWAAAGGRFEGTGWHALGALLDAAEAGDRAASGVVDDLVDTLGVALGGLVNLANPQRVVVGGWVGLRLMESLAGRIDDAVRANALARPGSQYELLPATFGGDTVAVGAAIMPLETIIHAPRVAD